MQYQRLLRKFAILWKVKDLSHVLALIYIAISFIVSDSFLIAFTAIKFYKLQNQASNTFITNSPHTTYYNISQWGIALSLGLLIVPV